MTYQKKQSSRLKTILLLLGALSIGVIAASVPNLFQQSTTVIQTIGVEIYSDLNQTTRLTSIDWGSMYPGENKTVLAYIKNVNNTVVTLTLNTSDWLPVTASNYITLTWNYTGAPLNPSIVQPTIFMLQTSPDTKDLAEFTFNMIVTANEAS